MNKKILIDYDEYSRLTKAANLYEELLKDKDGKGSLSQIIAEKEKEDAIHPPIAEDIGSITTPPNATLNVPHIETKARPHRSRHFNKHPATESYIKDKWFFIGKPKK